MASFEELYNIAVGNQQQQQVDQQQQAIQAGNFQDLYQQLVGANQQLAAAQAPTPQQPSAPQLQGWYQNNPEQAPTRQMNPFEQGLTGLSDWGEGLVGLTGFDANAGFTPENVGRFIAGLPFQMVGGFAGAPAKFYESISGQNVLDRPDQEGTAYQYELTPEQRGAEFVDALLDTGGLGLGGSAKMLGTGAKILTGGNAGERLMKGIFTSGMNPATTSAAKMFAARTAEDVVEEAGEEFAQSFLDDTRWNTWGDDSLSRATTSAAWGALGGGAMSAGGQGVSYLFDKANGNAGQNAGQNAANTTNSGTSARMFEIDKAHNQGLGSGTNLTQAVLNDQADRMAENTDVPGSVSTVNMTRDDQYNWKSCGLSTAAVRGAFEGREENSQETVANAFGKTVEQMRDILYKNSEVDRLQALRQALQEQGGRIRIIIGRNPDTNPTGAAYIDITDIYSGTGIKANRHVVSMFGADFDGDRTQIHFGDIDGVAHYAIRNLINPGTGASNIDTKYLLFARNEENAGTPSELVRKLKNFAKQPYWKKVAGQKFDLGQIIKDYENARSGNDFNAAQAVAEALDKFYAYIVEHQGIDPNAAYSQADEIVSGIVSSLEKEATRYAQSYQDAATATAAVYGFNASDIGSESNYQQLAKEIDTMFTQVGGLTEGWSSARVATFLGKVFESRSRSQNPFFREAAAASMIAHKLKNYSFADMSGDSLKSLYEFSYAWFFNQSSVGANADAGAEALFKEVVMDRFRREFPGSSSGIRGSNLAEACKKFVEIYNQEVKHINTAQKVLTSRGEALPFYVVPKMELSEINENDFKISRLDDNFIAAFCQTFSDPFFNELFDTRASGVFDGVSFGLLLEDASVRGHDYTFALQAVDSDLNKFFNRCVNGYNIRENRQARRVDEAISNIAETIRTTDLASVVNSGADLSPYMPLLTHLVETVQTIIGYQASFNLGIGSVDDFIKSTWGRTFLNGSLTPEMARNAIYSAMLSDTYRTAIALNKLSGDGNHNALVEELHHVALTRNSMIASVVAAAEEKIEGGGMEIVRYLTDLEVPLSSKINWFSEHIQPRCGSEFTADIMKATSDGFALTAVSTRVKTANSFAKEMLQESLKAEKDAIKSLKKTFQAGTEQSISPRTFKEAMTNLARNTAVTVPSDILTSGIFSRKQILSADRDKGRVVETADIMYQAVSQFTSGGLADFGRLLTLNFGVDSVENFQANRMQIGGIISGELGKIMLWDNNGNRKLITRTEFFEKLIGAKLQDRDAGPTDNEFFTAFENCPQLLSLLAPQKAYVSQGLSGPSLKVGYDGASLLDCIKKNMENLTLDPASVKFEERRNQLKQKLLDTPAFYENFVYWLPDEVFEPETSYARASRLIEHGFDDYVNTIIVKMTDSEDWETAISSRATKMDGWLSTIASLANFDAALSTGSRLNSKMSKQVTGQILSSLLDGVLGTSPTANPANIEIGTVFKQSQEAVDALLDLLSVSIKTMSIDPAEIASIPTELLTKIEEKRNRYAELQDQKTQGIAWSPVTRDEYDKLDKIAPYLVNSDVFGLITQGLVDTGINFGQSNVSPLANIDAGISMGDFTMSNVPDLWLKIEQLKKDYEYLADDLKGINGEDDLKKIINDGDISQIKGIVIIVNSRISEVKMKKILQYLPYTQTMNADFMVKEIECENWFNEFVEECRSELKDFDNDFPWSKESSKMADYIKERYAKDDKRFKYSSNLHFSAVSADKAFVATNSKINFSGARVSTGIGINGALVKTYAAIGLLPSDFLAGYGNQSQSASNPNASRLASLIDAFVDFIQEPMFLKLKKTMTSAKSVANSVDFKSIQSWLDPVAYDESADPDVFLNLSFMINQKRDEISSALLEAIKAEDEKGESHYKKDDTDLLSVFLTPYIQVNYLNQATGERNTFCIDSYHFDNGNIQAMAQDQKFSFLADPNVKIESASIIPVSLEEMSAKILNNISIEQAAHPGKTTTIDEYRRYSSTAALNWADQLNSMQDDFVDKVVRGIKGRKRAVPSVSTLDFELSAKQKMLQAIGDSDLLMAARKRRAEVSKKEFTDLTKEIAVNCSNKVHMELNSPDPYGYDNGTLGIVSTFINENSEISQKMRSGNNSDYLTLSQVPNENLDGTPNAFSKDGRLYHATHLIAGGSVNAIAKEFSDAYVSGHLLLIDADTLLHEQSNLVRAGIPATTITDAINHPAFICGQGFYLMNPSRSENLMGVEPVGSLSQIRKFKDPKSIRLMLVDPYRLGDAGMLLDPDIDWGFYDILFEKAIPISKLIKSVNQVRLVANRERIVGRIREELNKPRSESAIDLSYWQDLKTIGDQSLIDSVKNYIDFIESSNSDAPKVMKGVKNGDCIGITETQINGESVFTPIFYTGNVPIDLANVSLRIDDTGEIIMRYSCQGSSLSRDQLGNIVEYIAKAQVGQFSYKVVPNSASNTDKRWSMINGGEVATRFFGKAHAIIDGGAFSGRIVEKVFELFCRNAYCATRAMGGNIFFKEQNGPNGTEWILSDKLSDSFRDAVEKDNNMMAKLLSGNREAWNMLALDPSQVFKDTRIDSAFKNMIRQIIARNGDPVLFFCPTMLTNPTINADGGNVKAISRGLNGYDTEIMSFLQHWEGDVDGVMGIFNAINPNVCAADKATSQAVMDSGDAPDWLLGWNGMVYSPNTDPKGERKWFHAVIDQVNFFGENEAIGDVSRNASFSYQKMLQTLLRSGVYADKFEDTLRYMQMNADVPVLQTRKTDAELIKDAKNRKEAVRDYNPRMAVATQIAGDGAMFSEVAKYRDRCSQEVVDLGRHVDIKMDDRETSAYSDPALVKRLQDSVASWEAELGIPEGTMSIDDVMPIVLLLRGASYNGGAGDMLMTVGIFESALKDSIAAFNSSSNPGLLIPSGRITSDQTSIRVYQSLLPRSLAESLWNAAGENGKLQMVNHHDFNSWVAKMFAAQQESVDSFVQIDNDGQRRALGILNDGIAQTWERYVLPDGSVAPISGMIADGVSLSDVEAAIERFGDAFFDSVVPGMSDVLRANREDNARYLNNIYSMSKSGNVERVESDPKGSRVIFRVSDKTVWDHILLTLVDLRRALGILNPLDMPAANLAERFLNQGIMNAALRVGQDYGIGIYARAKENTIVKDRNLIKNAAKDPDVRRRYSAWRTAEMYGVENELLAKLRQIGPEQLDSAIEEFMNERGMTEAWTGKIMDIMSGKDLGITGQIENFLTLFATHASDSAPYWATEANGTTLLEKALKNPGDFFTQIMVGPAGEVSPDLIFAMQCMNVAKKGDMAQKNLVSAIFSEIAKRSTVVNFMTTAFITPYFNYTTNRMGKILQWVAPVSTIHKLLVDAAQGDGLVANLPVLGTGKRLKDLGLETVQVNMNLQEAIATDMLHLGPMLVAMLLIGSAGAIEPPEDDDKWGNFEEWTILGMRIDVAWWLEDLLGLALPVAITGKAAQLGKPRLDILVNGMAHYLSNNPVTKVADACAVLFDPFEEFYKDYDDTLDSFAKAWGGAPSVADMMNGKMTSWGLSFVSQFVTPLCLREIYNSSQEFEVSYKRIYEEGATGRPTEDALTEGKTQMATYQDAIIRKYTRNNPVMGFLADLVIRPQTGYMAHEMPRTVYYDPAQMNSLEVFSLYKDPFTKTQPKTAEEKEAMALQLLYTFQHRSVDELKQAGFVLDYETKDFMGGWLWDRIADANAAWYEMEAQGYTNYNTMGYETVVQMKQAHNNYINSMKSVYYDMLWNDEFSVARYNRRHSQYAQDANGEWYATGYYPSWFMPVTFGPGETPGDYKYVMDREHDWATESVVTGMSTGERGLIPMSEEYGKTPNIESYSSDGTNTGKSNNNNPNGTNSNGLPTKTLISNSPTGTNTSTGYPYSTGYRSGGGGGGGGGSKGVNYHPQTINAPNPTTGRRTNRVKSDYDYLRPNFETKGSREAYKRSDI